MKEIFISEEEIDKEMQQVINNYQKFFIKYYFKKEYSELTKEDKHEMDCFGIFGMTEWCIDNVKNKR